MSRTCRTCLLEIADATYIKLNQKDAKSKTVRAELLACIPELDLNLVRAPVICRNCVSILQSAYSFKTRCLLTEKRIRSRIRRTSLNGKRVTLTKLFRFSKETDGGKNCFAVRDASSNLTAGKRLPAQPGRASLNIEEHELLTFKTETLEASSLQNGNANNDERSYYYSSLGEVANVVDGCVKEKTRSVTCDVDGKSLVDEEYEFPVDIERDSDGHERNFIVMNSDASMLDGEEVNERPNLVTNGGAIMELTLQTLKFEDSLESSSTSTEIMGEISQDAIIDDIVEQKHELTFKTETGEALNFKEENSNNNEEESSNAYKTGTWDDVKEETRNITYDADGNKLIDNKEYGFPAATRDGEYFEENNSKNLDNQIKERCVNVRKLSTDSNYSCELYSDSTASSDANITEQHVSSVKKRRVNYEDERTNGRSTSSLGNGDNAYTIIKNENSQLMSDTDKVNLTKDEPALKTLKPKEALNEQKFKGCTVDTEFPIKECFVNLETLHLGDLANKSSFNANELLNLTSTKSLQTTNKKPKTVRHIESKKLSKHEQADSTKQSFCCKDCKYSTTARRNLVWHMRIHTSKKPFQCIICNYCTVHKQHLISHMRIHSGEKPFQCKFCEYSAFYKHRLVSHIRTHTDEKPFHCKICEFSAVHKQHLISHMRTHSGEKPFQCKDCDYSTVNKQNLNKHVRIHSGEKPFQCKLCEYSAFYKHRLVSHIRTHTGEKPFHCETCEFSAIHKQHLINHMRTHSGEKPFQCNECDYRAAQKHSLISHMRTHSGEKPFQCKHCDYRAVHKQNLIAHMRTHSREKPFQCTICEYSAFQKAHLIIHMRTHTGEKPFLCNVCAYSAVRKENLIEHMRIHTGIKSFQCKVCEYSAVRTQNLIAHMRTHSREKPFQCNECDYRAVHKQSLIYHMRTHMGEKPFQCKDCDYSTVHKQNLNKHVQIHRGEKPFQCTTCRYSTFRKQHLIYHMRIHTGEKPFHCNICKFSSSLKGNLTKHMRKHC